jgi:hypothetical protein
MHYTSYLDTAQHHGAAGCPHIVRDVRLYLIRTWALYQKQETKEVLTFIVYKNKKFLIKEYMYTHIDWIQYMHK